MSTYSEKILITGADGFIGSHLTEFLVKTGYKVRAFILYNSFDSWGWLDSLDNEIKDNIEIFPGDIRNIDSVRKAMQDIDIVFHLAALISIPYSYQSPSSYIDTNVIGTLNILESARDLKVSKIIHTSTSEVYGSALFVPITENHPLQAQSPYSASKIAADQLAFSFYKSFDIPVSIVRPFNTYGPRQSTRAVIPTVITQIASGKEKITLGDILTTRDFNFIEDTVSGFYAALISENSIGEIINIGSNYEVSIKNMVEIVAKIIGSEIFIESSESRFRPEKSEVNRLWASNKKAFDLLKWEPKYAGIEGLKKGLQKTIEWYLNKDNLALFKADKYTI